MYFCTGTSLPFLLCIIYYSVSVSVCDQGSGHSTLHMNFNSKSKYCVFLYSQHHWLPVGIKLIPHFDQQTGTDYSIMIGDMIRAVFCSAVAF